MGGPYPTLPTLPYGGGGEAEGRRDALFCALRLKGRRKGAAGGLGFYETTETMQRRKRRTMSYLTILKP